MLRYQVRKEDSIGNAIPLDYTSWQVNGDYMVFNTRTPHKLKDGNTVTIVGEHELIDPTNPNLPQIYKFTEDLPVLVNNDTQFSVKRTDEYPLPVAGIIQSVDNRIIQFENPHFFKSGGSATLIMYYVDTGLSVQRQEISVNYETPYTVSYGGQLPTQYEFYRNDFRFEEATRLMVYGLDRGFQVNIPLFAQTASEGIREDLQETKFVEQEIEKAIPPIINMEKDIYEPIIKMSVDGEVVEENVETIEFNLHFREREGDDWLVKEDGLWNGYPNKDDLNQGVTEGTINFNEGTRIIYPGGEETTVYEYREQQSDLLGFLGFQNSDVRNQKNRLKKSFLRLSFYDSSNQANQNLLAYSTVFMDSGKMFGKMVKNLDFKYFYPTYDEETGDFIETVIKTGITTSSEPYSYIKNDGEEVGLALDVRPDNITNEFVENRRLSSRITVKDKFNSDACSEGFYLYLFAEDDPNLAPQDIYMKVEFNHAGFGRTIPFMFPTTYDRDTLENGQPMKLSEILNQGTNPEFFDEEDPEMLGYQLDKFYIQSYIQFKYCFSKKLGKHVYYLAYPENLRLKNGWNYNEARDAMTIDYRNKKLIFNLYEAKVR